MVPRRCRRRHGDALRADPELDAALTALSERLGISEQEVVRRAVLDLDGVVIEMPDDAALDLVMAVAEGRLELEDIAAGLDRAAE